MNLAHASTAAANDNARKLSRAERLAASLASCASASPRGVGCWVRPSRPRRPPEAPARPPGRLLRRRAPGGLRLSAADVAELSGPSPVRADLGPRGAAGLTSAERAPPCAAARACRGAPGPRAVLRRRIVGPRMTETPTP